MRFSSLAVAVLFLSACASAAPTTPALPTAPTATQTAPTSQAARLLALAGRADAPTTQQIERVLGAPDLARQDGAGTAWTYRFQNCGLLLLFVADGRNAMRLAQAHPSARRGGEAAPSLEQCAAEADQRGS